MDWITAAITAGSALLGTKGGKTKTSTQVTPAPQTQFQMDLESSFRDWLFGSPSSGDKIRQLQAKKQSLIAQRQALVRYAGTAGYSEGGWQVGFGPEGDPDSGAHHDQGFHLGQSMTDFGRGMLASGANVADSLSQGSALSGGGGVMGGDFSGADFGGPGHGGLAGLGGYDVL
uniref:Uncharacterized protein n=1 Tax=viral metagenome TaxID=1070528 RepID=A0A6M3K3M9_9ZZZZ